MDIGIMGSAFVAQTVGGKLLDLGHTVTISSRDASQSKDRGEVGTLPSADDWAAAQRADGAAAAAGSFAEAAAAGELVVNATAGAGSLAALELAGASNLRGKILIDLSNPPGVCRRACPCATPTRSANRSRPHCPRRAW